jgi:uncharacterized protein (TIGR02246 family)
MTASPIEQLLDAFDRIDGDAVLALFAPDGQMLVADGRHARGTPALADLIADCLDGLRTVAHTITAQWHLDDVWIAELEATYELRDETRLGAFPRAMVLRDGPGGIADLHAYGAHERRLPKHRPGEEGSYLDGHWIPPL